MSYKSALVELQKRYGLRGRAKAARGPKRGRPLCRVGYYHQGERRTLWTGHGETWEAALEADAGWRQRRVVAP